MRQLWFTILTCVLCWCALSAQDNPRPVRNIVLVHGAWADGSGWKGVHDILVKDGYAVSVVQEPETSFQEDVAATKRVIAQQDGPCILVAHSYGGAVITEAGNDATVVGLVYIAAHMPDRGESEAENGKRLPSDLSTSNALKRTADGFTYLDPAQFHEYFAADLSFDQASFMARSQVLNFADNFTAVIANAAWRTKPSWMAVATKDRIINPDLERWYATRAKSHIVEIAGASHAVYVSRPHEVAAVIVDAASHALDPAADKGPLDAPVAKSALPFIPGSAAGRPGVRVGEAVRRAESGSGRDVAPPSPCSSPFRAAPARSSDARARPDRCRARRGRHRRVRRDAMA